MTLSLLKSKRACVWNVVLKVDLLLLGAELVRIERWIALLREGGDRQCARYGNKHGLHETLHGILPRWLLGRDGSVALSFGMAQSGSAKAPSATLFRVGFVIWDLL